MSDYFNVADIFGENVFNDAVMQERLPKKVYKKLHQDSPEAMRGYEAGKKNCKQIGKHLKNGDLSVTKVSICYQKLSIYYI